MAYAAKAFKDAVIEDLGSSKAGVIYFSPPQPTTDKKWSLCCSLDYLNRVKTACLAFPEGTAALALMEAGETAGRIDLALQDAHRLSGQAVFCRLRTDFWNEIPQKLSKYIPAKPLLRP